MAKQTSERLKKICDGRVTLYRLNGNPTIYARGYIQGKNVKLCTREESLKLGEEKARDWWDDLRAKEKRNEPVHGRLFSDAVTDFIADAKARRRGEISDGQIEQYEIKWNVLQKMQRADGTPWFDGVLVTDIDAKFRSDLREARSKQMTQFKRPVSPSTLKKDSVFVGQVLGFCFNPPDGSKPALTKVPKAPKFIGEKYKVAVRAQPALSLKQYNALIETAKKHAQEPTRNISTRLQREEAWAFIQLSVAAGLRPSEAYSLRWKDCRETTLNNRPAIQLWVKGKHFLHTGKREEGYAIYQGVRAYRRLKESRPDEAPSAYLFRQNHKDLVALLLTNTVIDGTNAREYRDEDGIVRLRTSKCFRPTGISMWLKFAKNPNLNDARKIFRTSIKEIEDCYDQNPVRSAAARMSTWKGEPDGLFDEASDEE